MQRDGEWHPVVRRGRVTLDRATFSNPLHFEQAMNAALKEFVRQMTAKGFQYQGMETNADGSMKVELLPAMYYSENSHPDTPTRMPSLQGIGSGLDSIMNYAAEARKVELAARSKTATDYQSLAGKVDVRMYVRFLQKKRRQFRTVSHKALGATA